MTRLILSGTTIILWAVALFYAWGAGVHGMNILSLNGFDWTAAPLKWQVLDLVYLAANLVVAVGLGCRWKISVLTFYLAAYSQMVLYTTGRSWILDVPEAFGPHGATVDYLDQLVVFHLVTLLLVTFCVVATRNTEERRLT